MIFDAREIHRSIDFPCVDHKKAVQGATLILNITMNAKFSLFIAKRWSELAPRFFFLIFSLSIHRRRIILSTTNKTQRYTTFFIIVNALHVAGGFSANHQELKNCTHSIWYVPGKQAWHIPDAVCTVLELLMMGGETARNM